MITIDATNKKPGRLATEVAILLMGKDMPTYQKNTIPQRQIRVENLGKLIFSKEKQQEEYHGHSGYLGGVKKKKKEDLIKKMGYKEIFRRAVYGMLPSNKLRAQMMKNLILSD